MKVFAMLGLLISLVASANSMANEIRLIKVKELGPLKNKVIYQSTNVKKVKKSNVVRGVLVARWGTQVYELVNGFYTCNDKNVCKLSDYERIATYKLCEVKNNKVKCSQKIAGDDFGSSYDRDVSVAENPDEVRDEYDHKRDGSYYEPEFPIRVTDEYSDLF